MRCSPADLIYFSQLARFVDYRLVQQHFASSIPY